MRAIKFRAKVLFPKDRLIICKGNVRDGDNLLRYTPKIPRIKGGRK